MLMRSRGHAHPRPVLQARGHAGGSDSLLKESHLSCGPTMCQVLVTALRAGGAAIWGGGRGLGCDLSGKLLQEWIWPRERNSAPSPPGEPTGDFAPRT